MKKTLMIVLTLLLSGRAMTLAYIGRAGGSGVGDPPAAWLMPLVGDAVIGLSALLVVYLMARRTGLAVWTTVVVWNVVAIWDALSAYLVHRTAPWPEFFMVEMLGSSMFFAAAAMHGLVLALAAQPEVRAAMIGARSISEAPAR